MRFSALSTLVLAARSAYGYVDSQPFFMFSTSELLTSSSALQSASSVTSDIGLSLSRCPSDYYILIEQHGVSGRDYQSTKNIPFLAQRLAHNPNGGVRSSITIPDVIGKIHVETWIELLQSTCGVKTIQIDASKGEIPTNIGPDPTLIRVKLSGGSSKKSSDSLVKNDAFFASIFDVLPTESYTVLYTTTPSCKKSTQAASHLESTSYEMDSTLQEAIHLDLKRDLGDLVSDASKAENQTLIDGPLFDRYQFFTPGIFMGLLAGFFLLSILYVAISAISSLQVTYAAFDKETGALAGKKTQ
ncbi:hypothetical protein PV10_02137 [Exophiala mesophila]|uniref:Protein BIG1 n=1 Tax=Exophiala mesophila TaxID=212818 RepID=A0A0D1ZKB8_EXOME|nr:uncharacterized protein PV10_02137 [Exophiala mesophila]KIV94364.1 hypothetical protein PV10_02137 [Exophiala mesophila]